jgi:UDPglucose 6-dehydrogenase
VTRALGLDLKGRHLAIWGLAFKPNTDDMREAPSLVLIEALLKMGATVSAYDPVAMTEAQRILGNTIRYATGPMQALEGADALIIVTEWKEFRSPDFEAMAAMLKTKRVFDGRNLYPPEMPAAAGLVYEAIGRKTV